MNVVHGPLEVVGIQALGLLDLGELHGLIQCLVEGDVDDGRVNDVVLVHELGSIAGHVEASARLVARDVLVHVDAGVQRHLLVAEYLSYGGRLYGQYVAVA